MYASFYYAMQQVVTFYSETFCGEKINASHSDKSFLSTFFIVIKNMVRVSS